MGHAIAPYALHTKGARAFVDGGGVEACRPPIVVRGTAVTGAAGEREQVRQYDKRGNHLCV